MVILIPMTTASSSSPSSPSTEEPQKEEKVEREVMIPPKEKTEDIKDDIEEQVHGKDDFVTTHNIDQGNVNQAPQRVNEEQGEATIEDFDRITNIR